MKQKTKLGTSKKAMVQRMLNVELAITHLSESIGAQNSCLKQCVMVCDVILDKGIVTDSETKAKMEKLLEEAKGNIITESSLQSVEFPPMPESPDDEEIPKLFLDLTADDTLIDDLESLKLTM